MQMAQLQPGSPLAKAWDRFKTTTAYAEQMENGSHVEAALWAAFVEGWMMALGFSPRRSPDGFANIAEYAPGRRR